jgi:hypothetical protein
MENCKVLPIDESYNREMLSIAARCPIRAGGMSLYFDKSPDFFRISRMKYQKNEHIGFFIDNSLKGFGSLGYYDALLKGERETVFTFYHFCLLPEARGQHIPELAVDHFFRLVRNSGATYGIGITLKGNRPVESYFKRSLSEPVPPVRVVDELVVKTILFSKRRKNETAYRVRNAAMEDIPAIVRLLNEEHRQRDFGSIFSEDRFLPVLQERQLQIGDYYVATDQRGEIKGVCLAWDCSSFRRTLVLQYSSRFYTTLLGYKALSGLMPMAPFPARGEYFRELTITDYGVAGRDPVIMHALLSEIYHRHHNRQYHFMNWASCGSDSLLQAASGFWHKNLTSHIIFTSMDPVNLNTEIRLPYIDIALI